MEETVDLREYFGIIKKIKRKETAFYFLGSTFYVQTGFPPFARRSLPFRQLRGSRPGYIPRRAQMRTPK